MIKHSILIGFLLFSLKLLGQYSNVKSKQTQKIFMYDTLKTKELNFDNISEAFPFISSDGLRLYYTSDRDGFAKIYFSKRQSLDQNFETSEQLGLNSNDTFLGASLTSDELSIYLFYNYKLYRSQRNYLSEEFSPPKLLEEFKGCYYAPSISPDGQELIAMRYWGCDSISGYYSRMEHFVKNENDIFEFSNTIKIPEDFEVSPGQFSKDGLSFFMTIEPKNWFPPSGSKDTSVVLKFTRKSLKTQFKNFEHYFKGDRVNHIGQVTFNVNETIMIGIKVTKNRYWSDNNLIYYTIK